MRPAKGIPALLTAAIVAALLLAAGLAVSGTLADRAPDAMGLVGATLGVLTGCVTLALTWLDLARSRTPREYTLTAVRATTAGACTFGMWHALADPAGPLLFLAFLFGALVALALMFLFAQAKDDAAAPHEHATV